LYGSDGLQKQGLLLARKNQRMAVYPLIYDAAGSSEWVFGGDGIVEDTYFTELYELSGGQCLGCPPPADPPVLDVVGKITLLILSEVNIRVNPGLGPATVNFFQVLLLSCRFHCSSLAKSQPG